MVKHAITQKFVMELLQVEVDQSSFLEYTQISHNGVNNFFQPQVQALQPMPLMGHQMLIYLENFFGVQDLILAKRSLHGVVDVVHLQLMVRVKTQSVESLIHQSSVNHCQNRTVSCLV